jgi:hypothetical protein
MTTAEEKEFDLLLSEAQNCNGQIGNFFELQIKIVGVVVSAVGLSLSLLAAAGQHGTYHLSPASSAKILVALSGVMSFAVIQGAITYAIAIGYMHYKALVVAPRLKQLLLLSEVPLATLRSILRGPTGVPLLVASGLATLGILAVDLSTLTYAWILAPGDRAVHLLVGIAGLGLAAASLSVVLVVRGLKKLGDAVQQGTSSLGAADSQ